MFFKFPVFLFFLCISLYSCHGQESAFNYFAPVYGDSYFHYDHWALFSNPSLIPVNHKASIHGRFIKPFSVEPLSIIALTGTIRTSAHSGFSLSLFRSHIKEYDFCENLITAGQSIQAGKNFRIGLSLRFVNISYIIPYTSYYAGSFAIGFNYKASKKIITGIAIYDPVAWQNKNKTEASKSLVAFFGYKTNSKLTWNFQIKKTSLHQPRITAGLTVRLHKLLTFYAGIGINPITTGAGVLFNTNLAQIKSGTVYHHYLGHSTYMEMGKAFN